MRVYTLSFFFHVNFALLLILFDSPCLIVLSYPINIQHLPPSGYNTHFVVQDVCNVHTYLLTPLSTVLLEKPTGFQLIKKIPRILWNPEGSLPH
jgi:hypothetical protein